MLLILYVKIFVCVCVKCCVNPTGVFSILSHLSYLGRVLEFVSPFRVVFSLALMRYLLTPIPGLKCCKATKQLLGWPKICCFHVRCDHDRAFPVIEKLLAISADVCLFVLIHDKQISWP